MANHTFIPKISREEIDDVRSQISSLSDSFTNFRHTVITSNSDLNDLTIPGFYSASSSAIATSLSNCPYTSAGFSMIVMPRGGLNTQVIMTARTLYTRILAGAGWSTWYKFEGTQVS